MKPLNALDNKNKITLSHILIWFNFKPLLPPIVAQIKNNAPPHKLIALSLIQIYCNRCNYPTIIFFTNQRSYQHSCTKTCIELHLACHAIDIYFQLAMWSQQNQLRIAIHSVKCAFFPVKIFVYYYTNRPERVKNSHHHSGIEVNYIRAV